MDINIPSDTDGIVAELARISAYKPTKAERRLNHLGDKISTVAGSDDAAAFLFIEREVSNLTEKSKIVMAVLDEVARLHPITQAAILLFKAALNLELGRRENDVKIRVLCTTMCDTMEVLTHLKGVASLQEAEYPLLKRCMDNIVASIKLCAKVCDSYRKQSLLVKIFTSSGWKTKFAEVGQRFVDHRSALQTHLHVELNIAAMKLRKDVSTIGLRMETLMTMVFEHMGTLEERELASFISSKSGGAGAVLENKHLLAQIIAKQRSSQSQTRTEPGVADVPFTVDYLQKVAKKTVDSIINGNECFEDKFAAMSSEIDKVQVAILGGPHERIIDEDLHHIWKEMGWKNSVKAKHLVMAIHDHFAKANCVGVSTEVYDVANKARPGISPRASSEGSGGHLLVPRNEAWALRYITASRAQLLVEAINHDLSSFVTVSEVNAFTSMCPAGWSLPCWVAYWTYGFEMTVQWYYRRIRALFSGIHAASYLVLAENRRTLGKFISSPQLHFVENIMSGLHRTTIDSEIDWERDDTFTNFKAYVVEQESEFERRLRLVKYRIDEVETLRSLIARGQRPETYILPVVFLLLRRSLAVIQQASTCVLDTLELGVLVWSLDTVWEAARDRVKILRTMFKFQNFNNPKQLGNFSHGLYAHLSGQIKMSPFWERDPAMDRARFSFRRPLRTPPHIRDFYSDPKWDADPEMGCNSEWDLYSLTGLASDELPLSYPSPQVESLDDILAERPDLYAANAACAADPDPGGVVGSPRLLVGHWQGSYTDDDNDADRTDGLVILTITSHLSDGTVAGCGKDVHGPFTISGTLTGLNFAFIKTYAVLQSSDGEKVAWCYQAELQDADMNTMEGSWGLRQSFRARSRFLAPDDSESESESDSDPHADDLAVYGSFTFTRRPVGFHLACPSADEFAHNRPRALWKLAINVAIHLVHVRSRTIDWNSLRKRRQLREQYMQLHMKKVANPYSTNYLEEREREELVKRIHPDDLVVWNALGVMRSGCGIIHG
ncbi:uncharacterized protein TRAVEDRAFT_43949 [Trametes versicolor FP-101664 SS1]|uniref:uncharacterized protein n=1 Tax=Trametes versicolor (strain FP-101664) TaxID=717944 RepID=UPI0004622CEE|nr:uncharacterized protein TRAVEDRAFT_43949 [Trametes versicolor FP-101664 SS1]EIW63671.1 hypothetical protein TRAVEDRAFT_43949 [Trametes versicolor FP-101664 SS1]